MIIKREKESERQKIPINGYLINNKLYKKIMKRLDNYDIGGRLITVDTTDFT